MGHPAVWPCSPTIEPPPVVEFLEASLVEFLEAWNEDSNLVWRVRTGHLIHLLEDALASIEALETLLSDTDGSGLNTDVSKSLGPRTVAPPR